MSFILIGVVATLSMWEKSLLSFMLAQQYFKLENVKANEGGEDAAAAAATAANGEDGAAKPKPLPRLS